MTKSGRKGFKTVPISPDDVQSGFCCGVHALDDFFARHALANDKLGLGKTFVLHPERETTGLPAVLGFYTLSMADIEGPRLPAPPGHRLPRYPLPVALLGRLAVARDLRGRGIGGRLLRDALMRVVSVSGSVGCFGVVVDAKDESSEQFYGHYGFVAVGAETWPRRMFLSIYTLKAAASSKR